MKSVVICGGGIIGCSIAYYLSKLDPDFAKIIIVERNEIAGHASGKAGGFLGKYYTIDIQMTRALTYISISGDLFYRVLFSFELERWQWCSWTIIKKVFSATRGAK